MKRTPQHWRPKAWTWLEPQGRACETHLTVDPREGTVLRGGTDEEGRFVVQRADDGGEASLWVGDRRHWTEVPPKP